MLIIKKEKKIFFCVDLISRIGYRWIFREDLISRKQFLSLRYLMLSQWYCDILMRQVLQHSNSIKSLLHYVSINLFYCTHLLFFSFIPQFDISVFWPVWALAALLNPLSLSVLIRSFRLFCFLGCCECWLPWIRLSIHYGKQW